ncbi:hypothetical protein [Shewanella gelidii]|nr:hypothetical protein [Shewanella gelidii]MCL1097126.1 hypothetical protein [Shewanella gelidii]
MESCSSKGESTVASSVEAHTKIQLIINEMQHILDSSVQFDAAVEQQSTVSDEISRNIIGDKLFDHG